MPIISFYRFSHKYEMRLIPFRLHRQLLTTLYISGLLIITATIFISAIYCTFTYITLTSKLAIYICVLLYNWWLCITRIGATCNFAEDTSLDTITRYITENILKFTVSHN